MVTWKPHSVLPSHYHPTGALYVVQNGTMYFPGESVPKIEVGEIRWVRSGHFYDGEGSLDIGLNIIVLGADTHPMVTFET